MAVRILCVANEVIVLTALCHALEPTYDVITVGNGQEGVQALQQREPFAVIICDQHIPGMSGVRFLALAKGLAPSTARIILITHADVQTAIDAVNESAVLRMLTKPFRGDDIINAVQVGVEHYYHTLTEVNLYEETLEGSIRAFVELLELTNPPAFAQSQRIARFVTMMVNKLGLPSPWQFQLAALLAPIGMLKIPQSLVQKNERGERLSHQEQAIIAQYPNAGGDLLKHFPRLGEVAEMVRHQLQPAHFWQRCTPQFSQRISMGAHLLKVAIDYDKHLLQGNSPVETLATFEAAPEIYDPSLIRALRQSVISHPTNGSHTIPDDKAV